MRHLSDWARPKMRRYFSLLAMLLSASVAPVPAPAPAPAATIYNLGTLGGTDSYGQAINAGGQVVGYNDTVGEPPQHAFRYTGTPGSGGVMSDLGTLGGTG